MAEENLNENLDSTSEENDVEVLETDDIEALREQHRKALDEKKQLLGRAKRAEATLKETELKLKTSKEEKPKETAKQSGELDYAQLAYLAAKGIEDDDELELVREIVSETGKELKTAVSTNYFQSRLKELRGIKTARAAMPKSSTRFSPTSRDSLEYWVAKYEQTGELPSMDQRDLRQKVIKARLSKEENASKFADIAIVR